MMGLELLLLFLNVAFVVYTLSSQGTLELVYNNIVTFLNIAYYLLRMAPSTD